MTTFHPFEVEVGAAIQDDSPDHLWPEPRNPGNQWLANHKGRRKAALEVIAAGEFATWYVRAALVDVDPTNTWADLLTQARRFRGIGRPDLSHAIHDGLAKAGRLAGRIA